MARRLMQLDVPRRRLLPVFAMLALHGAFLLAWLGAPRQGAPSESPTFIYAMMVPAPKPLAAPKPAPLPRASQPRPVQRRAAPVPASPAAPTADAPPQHEPVAAAPAASSGLLEQARAGAGAADLALRGGKALPPLVRADTPFARFEKALEGAHVGGARTVVMDRYVAADGVVITRVTERGRVRCFMSGAVNARHGILTDTSRPNGVNCPPSNAGWTRI